MNKKPSDSDRQHILAIDHGTSGIKAAIVSSTGSLIDFAYRKTATLFLPDGGIEQDPDEWWQALLAASRKLIDRGSVNPRDIAAVSVSSTFSTTVAVDHKGQCLMNAVTWMDSRGAPYVKKLMGGFPSVAGYNIANLFRWVPKTAGGPTLSGKDDIAHLLLIKERFPEVYDRTHMFLPSKDFLNLKLTGKFAATFDSIQLFWVTDVRDINNVRYDPKLIEVLGIASEKLPPLIRSTEILGTLKPDVAQELGLPEMVPVVAGSPDHQTACIGSGAVEDYQGHIYIGTSSWVQCIVPFKKTDVLHSIASFPTAIPSKYQSVNEQDMAGGCLEFLLENIVFSGDDRRREVFGDDPYRWLNELAAGIPAGSGQIIFAPWLNGERTPVDNSSLRGGFYNLSSTSSLAHMVRAVMEGVAFNTRWSLLYVEKFIKKRLDTLNIIGGGAESDLWCQIFADVLNRDIRQVENPRQANARGAAFIASVGLGLLRFEDIPKQMTYRNIYQPNSENRKIYDKLYREFIGIYRRNKGMFRRLNRT